jgi:hypothetical protein
MLASRRPHAFFVDVRRLYIATPGLRVSAKMPTPCGSRTRRSQGYPQVKHSVDVTQGGQAGASQLRGSASAGAALVAAARRGGHVPALIGLKSQQANGKALQS